MKQGQKKSPLPLILMIGIPVLAIAVVGILIGVGVIKLPGSKKKPAVIAANNYKEEPDLGMKKEDIKTVIDPPETTPLTPKKPVVKTEPVQVDLEKGAKQIAKVWANMEASKLKPIAEGYKIPDLARVMVKLPPEKSAELLAELEPDLATKLSQEIEKISSLVPTAPPG